MCHESSFGLIGSGCQQYRVSVTTVTLGSHMRTLPPAPTTMRKSRLSAADRIVVGTSKSSWVMEALASALATTRPRELKVMVVAAPGVFVTVTVFDPALKS